MISSNLIFLLLVFCISLYSKHLFRLFQLLLFLKDSIFLQKLFQASTDLVCEPVPVNTFCDPFDSFYQVFTHFETPFPLIPYKRNINY